MKAAVYHQFKGPITLEDVADPTPENHGVVIRVEATGICRSDWHGWMGHDADISLPHVPGHELAGTISAIGSEVKNWRIGDRVTLPFVCGCGHCNECHSGNEQVCDNQFQPGFTHWGSFAEYVGIHYAENNLVKLPDNMSFETAASLGCRFITSFRGIVDQGRVKEGEWVAVHGCGGVGLAAIMIAHAMGAKVIAIDIFDEKLALAKSFGADFQINATKVDNVAAIVKEISFGGVHLSMDALGSKQTSLNSINSLKKRGRHVQVGLMAAEHSNPSIPMGAVIANELEIIGSHGMQAHRYKAIFDLIEQGTLHPEKLIGKTVALSQGAEILMDLNSFNYNGITVINKF